MAGICYSHQGLFQGQLEDHHTTATNNSETPHFHTYFVDFDQIPNQIFDFICIHNSEADHHSCFLAQTNDVVIFNYYCCIYFSSYYHQNYPFLLHHLYHSAPPGLPLLMPRAPPRNRLPPVCGPPARFWLAALSTRNCLP